MPPSECAEREFGMSVRQGPHSLCQEEALLRGPNTDESELYSEKAVLDLLHVAGVEAGTAAETLRRFFSGFGLAGPPNAERGHSRSRSYTSGS